MKKVLLIASILLLITSCSKDEETSKSPLIGKWMVQHDNGGDTINTMEFKENGDFVNQTEYNDGSGDSYDRTTANYTAADGVLKIFNLENLYDGTSSEKTYEYRFKIDGTSLTLTSMDGSLMIFLERM